MSPHTHKELYHELRAAIANGDESMTHADALDWVARAHKAMGTWPCGKYIIHLPRGPTVACHVHAPELFLFSARIDFPTTVENAPSDAICTTCQTEERNNARLSSNARLQDPAIAGSDPVSSSGQPET